MAKPLSSWHYTGTGSANNPVDRHVNKSTEKHIDKLIVKPADKPAVVSSEKSSLKNYSLFYILLAAILALTPFVASCSAGAIGQSPPAELIVPVEAPADLVAVRRGDIKPVKVAEAIVVPYSLGLSFRAADAPISAVYVTHGQSVVEGELLAELDVSVWLDRLANAREELSHITRVSAHDDTISDVRISLAQMDLYEAASELDKTLAELNLLDLMNRDIVRRETQDLDRERLQARIDALEAQQDNYYIYAPFDGIILSIEALTVGDYPSGRVPFMHIADLNRLTLRCLTEQTSFFSAAQSIVAVIGDGEWDIEIVPYTLEEQLAFYYEGITPPARFNFIDGDGGDGGDGARNQGVPPTDKRVLIMSHEIGREDVIIIPINAAHIETASDEEGTSSRQDFAYVDLNGARERRDIRCGRRSDVWIEVIEGLEEGELVYVD